MADATGRRIGLVPAAHDGTRLSQWSESEKSRGGHSLYGALLERVARAGGRLRGLLWYQGESDAHDLVGSQTYGHRLDQWIAALREDLGAPDLPVVAVQIGRALPPKAGEGQFPGWDLVREAIATLPERTRATAVTSAVDLPLVDCLHVNTTGLIRLGRRMARLALHLTDTPSLPAGPRVVSIEPWTTPGGGRNALRVGFDGVTGGWSRADALQGFSLHPAQGSSEAPPVIINVWVDTEVRDGSVIILLTRQIHPGEKVGYGLGKDPRCDLVDLADMPLCSFLPRGIGLSAPGGGELWH